MGDRYAAGLTAFNLPVEPVPAARPRVGRFGTYYPKRYEHYRKAALERALEHDGIPTDKPLVLFVEVVATKPKTGKLTSPNGDVDNFHKGPLDALTKSEKFWKDDKQIVGLLSFKRYAEPGEEAGTRLHWFELDLE